MFGHTLWFPSLSLKAQKFSWNNFLIHCLENRHVFAENWYFHQIFWVSHLNYSTSLPEISGDKSENWPVNDLTMTKDWSQYLLPGDLKLSALRWQFDQLYGQVIKLGYILVVNWVKTLDVMEPLNSWIPLPGNGDWNIPAWMAKIELYLHPDSIRFWSFM